MAYTFLEREYIYVERLLACWEEIYVSFYLSYCFPSSVLHI
jgi:hypothetical protein